MSSSRRHFLAASTVGLGGLLTADAFAAPATIAVSKPANALRICFFTDSHLPTGLNNDPYIEPQKRICAAFDRANSFRPDAFIFGSDNVMAVDDGNNNRNSPELVRAQFDGWSSVVCVGLRFYLMAVR